MKILLVRPDSPIENVAPPVGLGYLSHAMKTVRGDETRIIDGRRFRLRDETILRQTEAFSPDMIGITAMTYEAPRAASLIAKLKNMYPQTPIVFGGPHATACGVSLMSNIRADYLVVGEGEETMIELLDAIEGKRNLCDVKGLVWRDMDEVIFNGHRPYIRDLNQLQVDWEAIDPERYFGLGFRNAQNTVAKSGRRLPVFTSRGCPFGCTYCHRIFGREYRTFDTPKVISGMIDLRDRYRLREFEIIDDAFNINLDRAKDFMHQIIERKLACALSFPNGLRADIMDEELLELMVRAGVYRINYAIESASPRVQKLVRKNLNLECAREVVDMTASRRIVTGTYNMLGFPSETEEEMAQTVDYVVSLKNHIASFFYLNPFPGTEIAESDHRIREKVRKMDFAEYSGLTLNLSAVEDAVLKRMRRSAYRRFYFAPARMARILRDVPKNRVLFLSAYAALRLSFRENVHY